MSALGHKRTLQRFRMMSALPSKADMLTGPTRILPSSSRLKASVMLSVVPRRSSTFSSGSTIKTPYRPLVKNGSLVCCTVTRVLRRNRLTVI